MRIGPTFAAEIIAAGLMGLPFAWGPDGVTYDASLSNENRARVEAVLAAHDPDAAAPEPVPDEISDRQFAQALADLGVISRAEALAFVKRGEVPAALQAAIDAIPGEEERFAADMQVSGATTFERQHPSTLALAQALGWSDAQMDDLWRRAADL